MSVPNPTDERMAALGHAETPSEAADLAVDFIFEELAEALGVTFYTPCDGTETWEGDVRGTLYAILRAGGVLNDENEVARHG